MANGFRVLSRKVFGGEDAESPAKKSYVGRELREAAIQKRMFLARTDAPIGPGNNLLKCSL